MYRQTLNGTWQMQEREGDKAYEAKVPGTVLSCLLEHEAIPDPYYRDNEYEVRDLFWKDYSFKRTFTPDAEVLAQEHVDLVCHSLDTLTEVYLNGRLLGRTDNMHRTWKFAVENVLREGENKIEIIFLSALQYARDYKTDEKKEIVYESPCTTKGNEFIRKAHSMFGWDWGAQLIDAGIQRDIELVSYTEAVLEDVDIVQTHRSKEVEILVHADVAAECGAQKICVTLTDPDGISCSKEVEAVWPTEPDKQEMTRLTCGKLVQKKSADISFTVENPQLWWPNGFGEHPLYRVNVTLVSENNTKTGTESGIETRPESGIETGPEIRTKSNTETREFQIGLRTLYISQEKDEWGSEFAFCINGVKIFTMGANYIPEDCVYPRVTRQKLESLIDASVRANYNCLRVWGGGYYPSDYFYELCDKNGLIVWQDLMFACNVYEVTEAFEANIAAEAKENVRRLRHHACLGLWCGNNELETAWVNWTDFDGNSEYLRADYIRQFEYILPKAVKEVDDRTFYWPSSPSSGGCFDDPNAENRGDVHYWEVWHGQKPFTDYRNYYFRFCSEFGFQSFPGKKTVWSFTEEEDRNIFSTVMESHQKNSSANGKILYYLSENFRNPKNSENLLYVSQILQAAAIKYGVEHWRRNRGRCMGALYWQINDEWPVASWSSIDYYGRWKALHYYARNFYAPVAGSVVRNGFAIEAWLENESLSEAVCEVEISLKTMDLTVLKTVTARGSCQALSAAKAAEADFGEAMQGVSEEEVFVAVTFRFADGRVQREAEPLVPYKHLRMQQPEIQTAVREEGESYLITVTTDVMAAYVELELEEADCIFSDNYFMLTDREPVTIALSKKDIFRGSIASAEELKQQLRIKSLRDSYEFK